MNVTICGKKCPRFVSVLLWQCLHIDLFSVHHLFFFFTSSPGENKNAPSDWVSGISTTLSLGSPSPRVASTTFAPLLDLSKRVDDDGHTWTNCRSHFPPLYSCAAAKNDTFCPEDLPFETVICPRQQWVTAVPWRYPYTPSTSCQHN